MSNNDLNDQLTFTKKCIDNLWRNLALVGQMEGINWKSTTDQKRKDIQRMLCSYRLARANLFTDDSLEDFVDTNEEGGVVVTTNTCLAKRPSPSLEDIAPVYPSHEHLSIDQHICLCGKKGIRREFLLECDDHQILLGSKCILHYSTAEHPDHAMIVSINKKLNEVARRRQEQQIIQTHFDVVCSPPTSRYSLLEEATIKIISNREQYRSLGDRIRFSFPPKDASYYYSTFLFPKFNTEGLTKREKSNIRKEPLFRYLQELTR